MMSQNVALPVTLSSGSSDVTSTTASDTSVAKVRLSSMYNFSYKKRLNDTILRKMCRMCNGEKK